MLGKSHLTSRNMLASLRTHAESHVPGRRLENKKLRFYSAKWKQRLTHPQKSESTNSYQTDSAWDGMNFHFFGLHFFRHVSDFLIQVGRSFFLHWPKTGDDCSIVARTTSTLVAPLCIVTCCLFILSTHTRSPGTSPLRKFS